MRNMMLKMVTEPHKEIHNEVKESVLGMYMGVGEMAWRLRSVTALAKKHSLVLSTLVGWCKITFIPIPGDPTPYCALHWQLHSRLCACMHAHTCPHTYNLKVKSNL